MDRRAAGALLALAACIASSAAAPTASNHTALDLYEGATEGCYYNFQHYGEGDRIMTNEPCLNCTCHNRMLMCYLRVCPFTKAIGQDCTVEKRADQCCPIITCPDVPVDLLTSTSTSSPAEYGATGLGKLDRYGCSINGKYFPEGSKVPPTPNKPCENCYCIRNMTTCVMQECTLHVDGCTPIYHKDVCCPIRYSCDHPEDELPLLDDMSTTVRPTPGFLLPTTTISPVTQMTQDCIHNNQVIADGASITTEKACEHCYCMKGDIVCVVQECGAPMENEGKNCTSLLPREGQCCPDTYICEGDELSTEIYNEATTDAIFEKLTTLSPPRRSGAEGSGYRIEPNEALYTTMAPAESELEGSGEEGELTKPEEEYGILTTEKLLLSEEIPPNNEENYQHIPVTTKAPKYKESETSTKEIDTLNYLEKETINPQVYSTSDIPPLDVGSMEVDVNLPHEHVTLASTSTSTSFDQYTTESMDSLNTVPDISPEHETSRPALDKAEIDGPHDNVEIKNTPSTMDLDVTSKPNIITSEPEYLTPNTEISDDSSQKTTEKSEVPEKITAKDKLEAKIGSTTSTPIMEEIQTLSPGKLETVTVSESFKEKETTDQYSSSITNIPLKEIEKVTTELNHAQNTVIVSEEDSQYPHITTSEQTEKATASDFVTDKTIKEDVLEPEEHVATVDPVLRESETTTEPDKGLNTIPSEMDDKLSSQSLDVPTSSSETKTTDTPIAIDKINLPKIEESSTTSETSTPLLESHITKVDLYTITTEPSFRKEDESSISPEKINDESGPTTIKAEFVDEGLIPTSTHDEKLSTGPDVPSTDEDITTVVPEYNKELEETVASKQPTTESLQDTLVTSLPGKVADATDNLDSSLQTITDKPAEDTDLMPETHEEPSRIPGEGDCLLNGVTYKNNTIVPSTNKCYMGCKCVSSIIKCDPIICSPPPDYVSNCQSIYDTPDSCCPTYVCDHPRETIPPQSDNQMSGTEPPMISPTIECRGDQCELSVPTKPTEPSEICTSGSCLSAPSDENGTKECGPEGCNHVVTEPGSVQPSIEHVGCTNGKCEPSVEDCAHGKCERLPTQSLSPGKPCSGDDCKITGTDTPAPQTCENGHGCKNIELPATHTIPDINCESNDCANGVLLPPQESPLAPCKGNDNCKPDEISPSDCTGDEPCRRKETSVTEELPPKCEDSNCTQKTEIPVTQVTISSISVETPSNEITEKITPTVTENGPESIAEITSTIQPITEKQYVPTKLSVLETMYTTQKIPQEQEILTEEQGLIEKEGTKSPFAVERYTERPDVSENLVTTKSDEEKHLGTQVPEEDGTKLPIENDRPPTEAPSEDEFTKIPYVTHDIDKSTDTLNVVEDHTVKSTLLEESVTKLPDVTKEVANGVNKLPTSDKDYSEPTIVENNTDVPNIIEEHTNEPTSTIEEVTKTPGDVIKYTDIPLLTTKQETKIPDITDNKPIHEITPVSEESTKIPNVTEDYSNKQTETVDENTDKSTEVEESESKTPDIIEKDTKEPELSKIPNKEPSDEKDVIKNPTVTEGYIDKLTETPEIVKDSIHEVPLVDELGTKTPDVVEEQSFVPVTVTEEGTEVPEYEVQDSKKPSSIEDTNSKIPDVTEKDNEDNVSSGEGETTIPPKIIGEELTKIPDVIKEKSDIATLSPDIMKEQTDAPSEDQDSTLSNVKNEHTQSPVSLNEENTKPPDHEEDHSDQTSLLEEDGMNIPHDHFSDKEKPILVKEEFPEKSTDMKEQSEIKPDIERESITPSSSEEFGTDNLDAIKDSSTITSILIDEPAITGFEGSTDGLPVVIEEANKNDTIKDLSPVSEETTEKPADVIESYTSSPFATEHTDKSEIYEKPTIAPESHIIISQMPDENRSSTKAPEIYSTEFEKEVDLTGNSIKEQTEIIDMEIPKVTSIPITKPHTTENEVTSEVTDSQFDSGTPVESLSQDTVTVSKSPDKIDSEPSIKEPQDSSTSLLNEATTDVSIEQEKSTETPLIATISEYTLPPLWEGEQITSHQEPFKNEHKVTENPEVIMTTEAIQYITKTSEAEIINKQEDISEQEPLVTKSPVQVNVEPQEEVQPESLDLSKSSPAGEETITTAYEVNKKTTAPGLEVTSLVPEIIRVTEIIDTETQRPLLSEQPGSESENLPAKDPTTIKDDAKTDQPDIYTPEKEEMITTTIDSTDTRAPVKDFIEIVDSNVTSEEQATTVYDEETTEVLEVSTINKIDNGLETLSSKATNGPDNSYSKPYEGYTDAPVLKETKPIEIDEEPTSSQLPELQETSDGSKPVTEEPHQRPEVLGSEKSTPDSSEIAVTELPVALVTEAAAGPTPPNDDIIFEEKTTIHPGYSSQILSDLSTLPPETSVTEESEPEKPKTTESSYTDAQITDDKEISDKPEIPALDNVQKTTSIPELSAVSIVSDTSHPVTEFDEQKFSTNSPATFADINTDSSPAPVTPEVSLSLVTEYQPDNVTVEKHDHTEAVLQESYTLAQDLTTERAYTPSSLQETTTSKRIEVPKPDDETSALVELTETTPYLIELEEHTHKMIGDISTVSPVDEKVPIYGNEEAISTVSPFKEDHAPTQDIITPSPPEEEQPFKIKEQPSTVSPFGEDFTHKASDDTSSALPSIDTATTENAPKEIPTEQTPDEKTITEKTHDEETTTKQIEVSSGSSEEASTISSIASDQTTLFVPKETGAETKPLQEQTTGKPIIVADDGLTDKDITTSKPSQGSEGSAPDSFTDTEKSPITESNVKIPTKEEPALTDIRDSSDKTTTPENEVMFTTKATTVKQEELLTPSFEDKYRPPEEKPSSETFLPTSTTEAPKPVELEPTEEIPTPEDEGISPSVSGYGEPDYAEEDQAFGPGTCRYGGKVYVSAQQIPRDDPCDFCFCFRSDIICLQQSCPPPIHGCHEEPIQGFCCPRYECPVSMATTVNVTTTTSTTTTTVPPNFPTHGYKGYAQRRGCQIKGHTYKVGEVVRSSSGPCLHCTCGGDGQMKCDPKACTPEPMLRQMIAAAVSAKRRR